jgi:hypothetical protein
MRPLHFISREKELELINRLLTIVNTSKFHPNNTALLMVSPDYSATVAMHLAHAWSVEGEIIPIISVDVPYPDQPADFYINKLMEQQKNISVYKKLVLVEAGIIRGGNWKWLVEHLISMGYSREDITLVALCENIHSITKSDFVGEYYDDNNEDLTFYFERYNKHWPTGHPKERY